MGDLVLKGATREMSTALRDIDIFGRWGGEEFLCILPNTNIQEATACAERLRTHLKVAKFTASISDLRVTASFGVTAAHSGDNANDIIKRCDLALYQAKDDGRDRVLARMAKLTLRVIF